MTIFNQQAVNLPEGKYVKSVESASKSSNGCHQAMLSIAMVSGLKIHGNHGKMTRQADRKHSARQTQTTHFLFCAMANGLRGYM